MKLLWRGKGLIDRMIERERRLIGILDDLEKYSAELQAESEKRMKEHEALMAEHEARMAEHEARMAEHEARMAEMLAGLRDRIDRMSVNGEQDNGRNHRKPQALHTEDPPTQGAV